VYFTKHQCMMLLTNMWYAEFHFVKLYTGTYDHPSYVTRSCGRLVSRALSCVMSTKPSPYKWLHPTQLMDYTYSLSYKSSPRTLTLTLTLTLLTQPYNLTTLQPTASHLRALTALYVLKQPWPVCPTPVKAWAICRGPCNIIHWVTLSFTLNQVLN